MKTSLFKFNKVTDFRAPCMKYILFLHECLIFLDRSLKSCKSHREHPSFNKEKQAENQKFYVYLHSYPFLNLSGRIPLAIHRRIPALLTDLSDFPVKTLEH